MQFNEHGNLEGGIIEVQDLSEIEQFLVNDFVTSSTRRRNFDSFCKFLKGLDKTKVTRVWIDGSFCSSKVDPNDIDCVVFIEANLVNNEAYFNDIKVKHNQLKDDNLDVYTCWDKDSFPRYTAAWFELDHQESYWMGKFGFDRNRNNKGIIEIKREVML